MTTGSGNGTATPAARARRGGQVWRVIAAGVVGTSLEWYDFFLYGTAAPAPYPGATCRRPRHRPCRS